MANRASQKSDAFVVVPISNSKSSPTVDYRPLVQNSRFNQILSELLRFVTTQRENFETFRKVSEALNKTKKLERSKSVNDLSLNTKKEDNQSSNLNQSLENIEDDLHSILQLLLYQCNLRNANCDFEYQNQISNIEDRCRNNEQRFKEHFEQLKHQVDWRLRNAGDNLDRVPSMSKLNYQHYHRTNDDIHFILGTSSNPSHSLIALKQMQLSQLKQHGSRCRPTARISKSRSIPGISGEILTPIEIIREIQKMIEHLQMEHEFIYRKLRTEITKCKHQNSKIDRTKMAILSDHLINIMQHVHDLHQLNTRFLIG